MHMVSHGLGKQVDVRLGVLRIQQFAACGSLSRCVIFFVFKRRCLTRGYATETHFNAQQHAVLGSPSVARICPAARPQPPSHTPHTSASPRASPPVLVRHNPAGSPSVQVVRRLLELCKNGSISAFRTSSLVSFQTDWASRQHGDARDVQQDPIEVPAGQQVDYTVVAEFVVPKKAEWQDRPRPALGGDPLYSGFGVGSGVFASPSSEPPPTCHFGVAWLRRLVILVVAIMRFRPPRRSSRICTFEGFVSVLSISHRTSHMDQFPSRA